MTPDWSDRVFRTIDYLSRFSFELRHIEGKSNVVADNLSCMIWVVTQPPFLDPEQLKVAQDSCEDCKLAPDSFSSLKLEFRSLDGVPILGDISRDGKFRPYLPVSLRLKIFICYLTLESVRL